MNLFSHNIFELDTICWKIQQIQWCEDGGVGEEQDGVHYVADAVDEEDDFDDEIEAVDDGNDGSVALQAEVFRVKMMVVNCLMAST